MNPKENIGGSIKLHPIQTLSIEVIELSIKVNRRPGEKEELEAPPANLGVAHGEYNEKNHTIQVAVKVEIGTGKDEQLPPFSMKVELVGEFEVDEKLFPVEKLPDWAKRNAPYIFFPFLREQVYSLTARAGFPPYILPLLEVPTIRIEPPAKPKEPKQKTTKMKS
jgi:preprotein translocase subunit SecB